MSKIIKVRGTQQGPNEFRIEAPGKIHPFREVEPGQDKTDGPFATGIVGKGGVDVFRAPGAPLSVEGEGIEVLVDGEQVDPSNLGGPGARIRAMLQRGGAAAIAVIGASVFLLVALTSMLSSD